MTTFTCKDCLNVFDNTAEFKYRNGGNVCKTCAKIRVKHNYMKLKPLALHILGDKCIVCGFSDSRALQIDHIDGNGFLDRKNKAKYNEAKIYRKIIRGDVSNYQLLCANCNFIKAVEQGSFTRGNSARWRSV